ncbi:hypothetical protein FEE59_22095 [Herbaspirillum sp. RU 5E]|nr:hypothetical protein [Herbaspirillum sp. RU 5E]
MIDESEFLELATAFGLGQGPVSITGALGAGNVLTAALRPGYSVTSFQWTRNGSDISGQTANTYTQLTTDRGSVIGCRAIGLAYAGSAGTVPVVVPGAPTGVSATAGDGSVTGTFTAPADNGGSAITGYQMSVFRASDNVLLGIATGSASPLTLNGLTNGVAVYVTVAAVNAIGVGAQSVASGSVVPSAAVPVFTAGPTLSGSPQVGVALSLNAGTLASSVGISSTFEILRDGLVVASGANPTYTPTLQDLGHYFQGRQHATSSAGSDDAGCAPQVCTPNVLDLLAFSKLPYCNDYRPVVGSPLLFSPATAQGASVTTTYQILWNGVLQGSPVAAPPVYTPSTTGTVAMRTVITNGSGALTYDTPALSVIAAPASSGIFRAVSAHNKINLFTMTVSTTTDRKMLCNDEHTVGSGAIKSFRLAADCIRTVNNLPQPNGNAITLDDVYAVIFYNGTRQGTPVRVTWNSGGTGATFADGSVDNLSDIMTPSMFGLSQIPAGATINLQTQWNWPKNTNMPSVEVTTGPTTPAQIFVYDPATANITAGLGSTANKGGYVAVQVTGGTTNQQTGPKLRIIGEFVAGDPKVIFGLGDSTFGQGNTSTTNTIFAATVNICPAKPPLAALNFQRSGGSWPIYNAGSVPGNAQQDLIKYCNVVLDGSGINSITTGASPADSSDLKTQALQAWATMKTKAVTATGTIRPLKIVRNGFMIRLGTYTAQNALPSDQVSVPRMSVGGDIPTDWDVWAPTKVADGTIDAYNPLRNLFNLNSDTSKPNCFKTMPGSFTDGLHPSFGNFSGNLSRTVIDALS